MMDAQAYQNAGEVVGLVFRYVAIAIVVAGVVLYVLQRYAIVSTMKTILAWMLIISGALVVLIFTGNALFGRLSVGSIQIGLAFIIIGYLLKQWNVGSQHQQWIKFNTSRFDLFKNHPALFTFTYITWTICLLVIIAALGLVLYENGSAILERFGRWRFRIAFNLFATIFFLASSVAWLRLFYLSVFSRSDEYDARRRIVSLLALIALFVKAGALLSYPEYEYFIGASVALLPLQFLVYFGQENYFARRSNSLEEKE
jgi:hypothetical protein